MIENLGKRQKPRKGDYYDPDGVLICGKCKMKREWHGFFPGIGMTWAPCICACDRTAKIENEKAKAIADRRKLAAVRRNYAFPAGSGLSKVRFEGDDKQNPKASEAVYQYARYIPKHISEGNNLVLYGDVGTGKSFFAAAVVNYAIDAGYKCLFTSFSEVINDYISTFDKRGYITEIKDYDLVVFDDFGVERATGTANEAIYEIINGRYVARKPMIITTNMDRNELNPTDMNKKRILSRILERAVVVPVNGADRRTARFRR